MEIPKIGPLFWKLVDRKAVPCADVVEWGAFCEVDENRRVGWTDIDGVRVSTIFLGVAGGNPFGPPMLFETVVFDDYGNRGFARYETWEQAEAGHTAAVAEILAHAGKPCEIS
jgi:hypothetical protein